MRKRLVQVLAAALLLVLGAGAATVAVSTAGLPGVGKAGVAPSVPDTLLLVRQPSTPPFSPTRAEVLAVQPPAGGFQPVLEGAQEPVVSPDGRALFFVQHLEVGERVRTAVVAVASDTFEHLWSADVAARPTREAQETPYALAVRLAATSDRVYVASHLWQSADPVMVVALDRTDGRERGRWSVDPEGRPTTGLNLVAAPDGGQLHVLAVAPGPPGRAYAAPELLSYRFRLPDGREEARQIPQAWSLGWGGRPTADGRSLFDVVQADGGTRLGVHFFDLATGTTERVDLPFRGRDVIGYERGLSHDGRRLYVFAPALGELAIVDLAERRLEQTVLVEAGTAAAARPLAGTWDSLRALLAGEAYAKEPLLGDLALSPDGRRLYAGGVSWRSQEVRPDGVWVIDTSTWRVTDRWLPGVQPAKLLLSGDGRYLYVQPWTLPTGALRVLDAATGAQVFATDALPAARLVSLAELYRGTYGKSPDAHPSAEPSAAPVAAMKVTADPVTVVGGDAVALELRFVAPHGRTVEPGQAGVRYEAPARVAATVAPRYRAEDARTLVLDPTGYGVYRATVVLPSPESWADGSWSVRVVAEWPAGLRRRAAVEDAVVVQRAFAGTDGRRYILQITTDPAQPVPDQPVAVRAAFVDAATRAPLPADMALAEGLPDQVEASFFAQGGATTAELQPVRHGVYAGQGRLWSPGAWRVWATLHRAGVPSLNYLVGSVQAVDR